VISFSRIQFLKFKSSTIVVVLLRDMYIAIRIIVSEIRPVHRIAFITFNCEIIYYGYIFSKLHWYGTKHLLVERRAM